MRTCLSVLLLLVALPVLGEEPSFEDEVRTKSTAHTTDFQRATDLADAGDVQAANKQLLDLADADGSPAMSLVIGNLLYNMDRDASYRLHKKAFDAQPKERMTNLEWAMERHRKGEYAEAVPLYEAYLKLSPGDKKTYALLADCLLRIGKLPEAVAAWDASAHARHHVAIDFAIFEIYGEISPLRRRADLLERVKKGDASAAEKLIDQDVNMDRDWWNGGPDAEALKHDAPLVEQLLGKPSKRFQAIECWLFIFSQEKQDEVAPVKARLEKDGLIVGQGSLPESSLVAARLFNAVVAGNIETRTQLLGKFRKELTDRAKSPAGDVDALNILCNLSQDKKDETLELERYGAERYADPRFALGQLVLMARDKKLSLDSAELKAALQKIPENSLLQRIVLTLAGEQKTTKEMLVAAIKAEYRHPSRGVNEYPDSYTLNAYFQMLKQKL